MLAVFDQSVAKSPEGLRSQSSVSESSALKDGSLIQDLHSSLHTNSVTINLGLPGFIAYSSHKQSPLLPRKGKNERRKDEDRKIKQRPKILTKMKENTRIRKH
ncbi:unnamed protein product [Camellia sinensis]